MNSGTFPWVAATAVVPEFRKAGQGALPLAIWDMANWTGGFTTCTRNEAQHEHHAGQ